MGLIISTCWKAVVNAFKALAPALLKTNHLEEGHPNNESESTMRTQIGNRVVDKLYYFEIGVGLLNVTNARQWARGIARNQNVEISLAQVVNLVCYTYSWSYAEIWKPDPDHLCSMYLKDYFVRNTPSSDDCDLDFERALRNMGHRTKQRGSIPMIWEIVGNSFVLEMPCWSDQDLLKYSDEDRRELVSNAEFKTAFAVPIKRHGEITHVLAFYRRDDRVRDEPLLLVVEQMGSAIGNCTDSMEDDSSDASNA